MLLLFLFSYYRQCRRISFSVLSPSLFCFARRRSGRSEIRSDTRGQTQTHQPLQLQNDSLLSEVHHKHKTQLLRGGIATRTHHIKNPPTYFSMFTRHIYLVLIAVPPCTKYGRYLQNKARPWVRQAGRAWTSYSLKCCNATARYESRGMSAKHHTTT